MDAAVDDVDRMLSVPEREMVVQTRPPAIEALNQDELRALGKRLRQARDRSRRISDQQQREMRGKTEPRGATLARDNTGSEGKTASLVEALKRVTAALRKLNKPTTAQVLRRALDIKNATVPHHPSSARTASKGMQAKESTRPTVRVDPREVGRVSKATKVAQAKRDR